MKNLTFYIFIFLISIVLLVFGFSWWGKIKYIESTDNAYVRGSITTISSRISGHVLNVPGVVNTRIKKGEILVQFDKEPFLAAYSIAKANLMESEAQIQEVEAKINAVNINIEEAKARKNLYKAKQDSAIALVKAKRVSMDLLKLKKERAESLFKTNTVSKSRLDNALSLFTSSSHEVNQAESEVIAANFSSKAIDAEIKEIIIILDKLKAEKLRFEARKNAAQGALKTADINLLSTVIKAPINGIIANRIVEPGVYMENGWPLMSIVPVKDIWIVANYKETQMKNIKIGQDVLIKSDAFQEKINGKVLSISPASASSFSLLPPQNASGNFVKVVQRVPVKISIDLPDNLVGRLVPGMSVITKVFTSNIISN